MDGSARDLTMAVTLAQGDITRERVDAIVNAANSGLRHPYHAQAGLAAGGVP